MNTKRKSTKNAMQALEEIAGTKLTLGSLLFAIRKGEDMSQVIFAEMLGISKQYLCDIEHQRRFVSPKTAMTFAKKLGYSADQFVRLSLQDVIDKEGINFIVNVEAA